VTDLAQRYGTDRAGRRPLLVAAVAVVAVAALAWLVWVMVTHSRPLVTSELSSFETPDQHTAVATVSVVRRDGDVKASCLLRARSSDHAIVGELRFTVGPDAPTGATLTRTLRTERQATSVELLGCTADGQPRPR
jgi:hypothetical protein